MNDGPSQPVRTGPYDFFLNQPDRGSVRVTDAASGEEIGAALVREGCILERALPHPDGLLVLADLTPMKVTSNPKGVFVAVPASLRDFDGIDLGDDAAWQDARQRLK
jgi:hypothetical protein